MCGNGVLWLMKKSKIYENCWLKQQLNPSKKEYNKNIVKLKSELAEVENSQELISSPYDKLKDDYSQLLDTNKKQENGIKKLKYEAIELSSQGTKEAIKLDAHKPVVFNRGSAEP